MIRSAQEVVSWARAEYGSRFAVVTALQKEGMVVVDLAVRCGAGARVITVDTGRLPEESYQIIEKIRERYGITVERIAPDDKEVERMVGTYGPDLFRDDVVYRKLCCQIRKVRPLAGVIAGLQAYAVGLRRGQSESRESVEQIAQVDGKWKISPLALWTAAEVEEYIEHNDVPVHPLYAKGYTSIGCTPCTRPIEAGEEERAGRWWWEGQGDKECGLHFTPSGKMVRQLDILVEEIVGLNA